MEEDSSTETKKDDLSSSHNTPEMSPIHSRSSSTESSPKSGGNLIAGSGDLKPSGAEAAESLSTEGKEEGAIGGGSSGDVKAEQLHIQTASSQTGMFDSVNYPTELVCIVLALAFSSFAPANCMNSKVCHSVINCTNQLPTISN